MCLGFRASGRKFSGRGFELTMASEVDGFSVDSYTPAPQALTRQNSILPHHRKEPESLDVENTPTACALTSTKAENSRPPSPEGSEHWHPRHRLRLSPRVGSLL